MHVYIHVRVCTHALYWTQLHVYCGLVVPHIHKMTGKGNGDWCGRGGWMTDIHCDSQQQWHKTQIHVHVHVLYLVHRLQLDQTEHNTLHTTSTLVRYIHTIPDCKHTCTRVIQHTTYNIHKRTLFTTVHVYQLSMLFRCLVNWWSHHYSTCGARRAEHSSPIHVDVYMYVCCNYSVSADHSCHGTMQCWVVDQTDYIHM